MCGGEGGRMLHRRRGWIQLLLAGVRCAVQGERGRRDKCPIQGNRVWEEQGVPRASLGVIHPAKM